MNVVDVVLVLAGLSLAFSGYRQGFITGVLSFGGFLGGGFVGMVVAPHVVGSWQRGVWQVVVAIGLVVLGSSVGQALTLTAAAVLRRRVTWSPARLVDAALGAVVSVISMLVLVWFLASAVSQGPLPGLSRAVRGSVIINKVDAVMPDAARGLFSSFRKLLADDAFPRVFGNLAPEQIVPVGPPDPGSSQTAAVRRDAHSIVKVTGDATSCRRSLEGTGFVVTPQHVLTNAHVVAGVRRPSVQVGGQGVTYSATVVWFDPKRDVAVLDVPDLPAPPLALGSDVSRGDAVVVAGFPLDGPYALQSARVRELIRARGPDIYGGSQVTRSVYSLLAKVEPGNSGGPLLSPAGPVVGLVFAKSIDDPTTGYALTLSEMRPAISGGGSSSTTVSTGGCAE